MSNNFKKIISYSFYFLGITFISLGTWEYIFNGTSNTKINIENANLKKSVSVTNLINKQNLIDKKELEPVFYNDVYDAINNSKYYATSFKGKLTHYGPDCASCSGILGCNRQNAKNGNIYYNDKEYGTIRIVATTNLIPCGSIIKIHIDKYDPNGMYAIVLDRGVGPGIIDLLKESQTSPSPVRTVSNVTFDIIRYGY